MKPHEAAVADGKAEAPGKTDAADEEVAEKDASTTYNIKTYRRERWLAAAMLLVLAAGIAVAVAVPVARAKTCVSCASQTQSACTSTVLNSVLNTFCWDANGNSLPSCAVAPASLCSPNGTPPCIGVGGIPAGYQCT